MNCQQQQDNKLQHARLLPPSLPAQVARYTSWPHVLSYCPQSLRRSIVRISFCRSSMYTVAHEQRASAARTRRVAIRSYCLCTDPSARSHFPGKSSDLGSSLRLCPDQDTAVWGISYSQSSQYRLQTWLLVLPPTRGAPHFPSLRWQYPPH